MIVDADCGVTVGWTRTHTTKDQKAHATVETKADCIVEVRRQHDGKERSRR